VTRSGAARSGRTGAASRRRETARRWSGCSRPSSARPPSCRGTGGGRRSPPAAGSTGTAHACNAVSCRDAERPLEETASPGAARTAAMNVSKPDVGTKAAGGAAGPAYAVTARRRAAREGHRQLTRAGPSSPWRGSPARTGRAPSGRRGRSGRRRAQNENQGTRRTSGAWSR